MVKPEVFLSEWYEICLSDKNMIISHVENTRTCYAFAKGLA